MIEYATISRMIPRDASLLVSYWAPEIPKTSRQFGTEGFEGDFILDSSIPLYREMPASGTSISVAWAYVRWSYTQRNLFKILLNQTEIRLYLPFSNWFGTKWTFVWFQINRKMVNTIWLRFNLIKFWKDFSVCTSHWKKLTSAGRETEISRRNQPPIDGHPSNYRYCSVVMFEEFQGASIGLPWRRGMILSLTAVRLIVVHWEN